MRRWLLTSIGSFALMLALSPALSASAQDGGFLIIGVFQCPEGYSGSDFADDCEEPAAGIEFYIATPNTGNVDSTTSGGDGLVTFSLEPFDLNPTAADVVNVGEPATQTGDYAVSCSMNGDEAFEFMTETLHFEPAGPLLGMTFSFNTGDDIACEWYRLTSPLQDDVEPPVGGEQIDELPSTGTGLPGSNQTLVSLLLLNAALFAAAGYAGRRIPVSR